MQTMMQDQILETLQSLKQEVHKRYKAELKGIFGSYTRGEAREDSDIDILVEFRKGATLLDLTGLGNFLEEKLQRKVDVVSQRAVREELRSYIYRDMVYL
ncbi:MAG: nucleotidyltransferase family protein [Deltaproteobacteria bacterium]|nr:nucleotidyltransferase family protein [Deltaproteobacteria bacterium]MBW2331843.1 nucleotidyltransferase family protein [Deltaproteobacteria bacterium]